MHITSLILYTFIYLPTWRAGKLGIFTHFTFTNLLWCSKSMNSLIYVYSIQIPSSFLGVLDHSRYHTSSYYRRPLPKLPPAITQKHLGMFSDTRLEFQEHLKSIFSKINRAIGQLRKLHLILPRSPLLY